MADSVLTTLNRDYQAWERDIDSARSEIKRIDDKKRREVELWDRDIKTLEKKIEAVELKRKDIFRQIERRQQEIAREMDKASKSSTVQKKSGWM